MTETSPDTTPPQKRRCVNTNAAGRPCGASVLRGSDPPRCWFHARENAEDRAAALSRGGRVSGRSKRLQAVIGRLGDETPSAACFELCDESARPKLTVFAAVGWKLTGEVFTTETGTVAQVTAGHWLQRVHPGDPPTFKWPRKRFINEPQSLRWRVLSLVGFEPCAHVEHRWLRASEGGGTWYPEAQVESFLKAVLKKRYALPDAPVKG